MNQYDLNTKALDIHRRAAVTAGYRSTAGWAFLAGCACFLFIAPVIGLIITVVSATAWALFALSFQGVRAEWQQFITTYPHMADYDPSNPAAAPLDWKED